MQQHLRTPFWNFNRRTLHLISGSKLFTLNYSLLKSSGFPNSVFRSIDLLELLFCCTTHVIA